MSNEQLISTLKGISCILAIMSEAAINEYKWLYAGLQLLNCELTKCIEALEQKMM